MSKSKSTAPFLEFKYLKNVMIDLGDGKHYSIPTEMRYQPNPQARRSPLSSKNLNVNDEDAMILLPYYDMDHVHKVELQDERPHIPKKMPGMSDAFHTKLCEQAYERAARAKNFNDEVRGRVNHYVKIGILEIVSDPFEGEEEIEGLSELAAALKESETEPSDSKPPSKAKK